MITGEIKNRIDAIWDTYWVGGITNPIMERTAEYGNPNKYPNKYRTSTRTSSRVNQGG